MKTNVIIMMALIIATVFTSCKKGMFVRGNGNVETEERNLSEFDKVANNGSFEVKIVNDDQFFVLVEAESNLISHIKTYTNGGALIIDTDENLVNRRPIKLEVHTPFLRAIELNGSGFIHTEEFESKVFSAVLDGSGDISAKIIESNDINVRVNGSGDMSLSCQAIALKARVKGSGDLKISGKAKLGEAYINGSGSIKSRDLYLDSVSAIVSGSGDIVLRVSEYLNAKIAGSGSIYYKGNPKEIYKEINGSGNIIKQ